ncbi:MAG: hypothetical protein HYS06_12040 [Methylocystis sp.]|nr:hypothetical protein [Methylocystis sp.]MBI3275951.1 hypothetical protein [Methylocystis sp.]
MQAAERIVAATLGGMLCVAASGGLRAAENPLTMTPLMAVTLDVGTKHIVSYFLSGDGFCMLTLMVADHAGGAERGAASRVQASISAGKSARFDTADGKSLRFACKPGAQAMSVLALDHLAANPDLE